MKINGFNALTLVRKTYFTEVLHVFPRTSFSPQRSFDQPTSSCCGDTARGQAFCPYQLGTMEKHQGTIESPHPHG